MSSRIIETEAFEEWTSAPDEETEGLATNIVEHINMFSNAFAKGALQNLQTLLTVNITTEGQLAIGYDDTLAEDYDGGPCNGFFTLVTIPSIKALIESDFKPTSDGPEDIGMSNECCERIKVEFVKWMEAQLIELKS